jgi:spermidine dehydrogenase
MSPEDVSDASLGMTRPIARRDFISGVVAGATAGLSCVSNDAWAQLTASADPVTPAALPNNYPPALTGLRGQYPGSFELAHAARDGRFSGDVRADDTGERYDLVVVGGGISGLAAAHFFRSALGDDRKILILDNHDDFGGHAKRNEFEHDGRTYLGYGGTMSIESPFPYSYVAKALIRELGIDVTRYPKYLDTTLYASLGRGTFFNKEHFTADKLVVASADAPTDWIAFFNAAPLTAVVRKDLIRIHTETRDYLPGSDPRQKAELLKKISYQDFLLRHAGLRAASLPFFQGMTFRNSMRVDTCPAFSAARSGAPGFQGMEVGGAPAYPERTDFHFPDGNATIARLLVNRLVPGAFGNGVYSPEEIVSLRARYDALDEPANATRIRLESTAIRVEHMGSALEPEGVRIVYARAGKLSQVQASSVILACFNNIIPFIVPQLAQDQKDALHYASKVPLIYTNVLVRNWEAWVKLQVQSIHLPNTYHTDMFLDVPVSMGRYRFPDNPAQPILVHLEANPNSPGLPRREQNRSGRAQILATPFETIERHVRSDMSRALAPGGFDAARDILAITVNRWPHGYAYTYDTLADPELPDSMRPHVIGRRNFGRIAIANADSGAAAYTNVAIDQAHRAVQETLIALGIT